MSYSDLYFRTNQNKYLGIIAGFVLIIFAVFLYVSRGISTVPSNAANKVLKRHELVNLSPHQAGIFWISDQKETGWVLFGKNKDDLKQVASDERDVGDKKNAMYLHYVTLKGLDDNRTYFYKIVSGEQIAMNLNKQPYTFKTPISTSQTSSIKPAYGKVTLSNGKAAEDSFVFYNYKDAVPFLALTKLTGEWLIPLQYGVSQKTNEVITLSEKETVHIEVINDNNDTSSIDALVSKTNPLSQTIVLGKDYKFLEEDNVLPASTQRIEENKNYPITIVLPKENAVIPGSKPLLKGQGVPTKPVKIQINSKPGYISRNTITDKGEWKVEVPVSLIAGSYVMTVTTEDKNGDAVTLTRKFSIAKSGEQVLGEASPSATIIPTSPTASPTASITDTPTPSPSVFLSPTITLPLFTATPISSSTPRLVVSGTPPGFNGTPVIFGGIGLIIASISILMIF